MPIIEDAHLQAALTQARLVLAEAISEGFSSQACAWFRNVETLERFLANPDIKQVRD